MRTDIPPDSPAANAARRHSDLTRAILRGYDIEEPDQTDAARMMHATLHGYVHLELSGGFSHTPLVGDHLASHPHRPARRAHRLAHRLIRLTWRSAPAPSRR
ncbi:TetR-like C-terminal domain-containing protein [Saccharothrix sp. NPDC042600]|uniref:TetR-like C-terminal domain-containing protein n=1 Tax=Saccharothrix TaxID=2071 RepID=UPI0033EFAE20